MKPLSLVAVMTALPVFAQEVKLDHAQVESIVRRIVHAPDLDKMKT